MAGLLGFGATLPLAEGPRQGRGQHPFPQQPSGTVKPALHGWQGQAKTGRRLMEGEALEVLEDENLSLPVRQRLNHPGQLVDQEGPGGVGLIDPV